MLPIISNALDAICLERDDRKYSASFEAASAIIKEFGEQGLAERIFSEIPRTIPFELVAELFELLMWQTEDNGGAIHTIIEDWLREGTDNRKMLIALNSGIYPFTDDEEMERVLSRLAATNIRISGRCKEIIQMRQMPKCKS
jgi:hypothetical protein